MFTGCKHNICSGCGQYSWTQLGSPVSMNWRSVLTITSIASWCCRILFLMGRLHLPDWKVETLASCTSKANACLHNLMYQMYLSRMSAPGGVLVHNGINGRITQTYLLNVEWWGTRHGSRVELLGTFCVRLPGFKKQGI